MTERIDDYDFLQIGEVENFTGGLVLFFLILVIIGISFVIFSKTSSLPI
jgi:hypothetical protein